MQLPANVDLLSIKHVESLIHDRIQEGKHIEYKLSLPTNEKKDKKEFLADVSSFANTDGGWLLYGISEEKGVATKITGIGLENADSEIAKYEDIILNGIEPRLPHCHIRALECGDGRFVIVIRVDKSWIGPHVINHESHWRFYRRRSVGKYPLDLAEVRDAFYTSADYRHRIGDFVRNRIVKIVSDETPLPLRSDKRIVLHLIPASAMDMIELKNIMIGTQEDFRLPQINRYGDGPASPNFDGYLSFTYLDHSGVYESYTQLYMNGVVEAVNGYTIAENVTHDFKGFPYIASGVLEEIVIKSIPNFINLFQQIKITTPVYVILSLLGCKGYIMAYSSRLWGPQHQITIDREILTTQPTVIEDFELNPLLIARPLIDVIWRASGWNGSPNFDENGQYKPRT